MTSNTQIFYGFLEAASFPLGNKCPFKKCEVGYRTYRPSALGNWVFNVKKNLMTYIRKTSSYANGGYEDDYISENYKINYRKDGSIVVERV